jgi:hypothetical protein
VALPGLWYPLVDLAAANASAGHDKEAKEAVAQLQKADPGFTVQTFAGTHWRDRPSTRNIGASSRACARRARRRRRRRIEPARPCRVCAEAERRLSKADDPL